MSVYIDIPSLTEDELVDAYQIAYSCATLADNVRNTDEAIYYYGLGRLLVVTYTQRVENRLIQENIEAALSEARNVFRHVN